MDAVWETLCPPNLQHAIPVPSVETACKTTYLTGFTATMLSSDFEPQIMGCMRIIFKGTLGCLLVSSKSLQDNLHKLLAKKKLQGEKVTCNEMKAWMDGFEASCSEADLKSIAEASVQVYHCKVRAGQALLTPPGFFVCIGSLESGSVCGARRGFFPKDLYDDADRAPAGTAFPSSKAVKQRNFVLRPDFQKMHAEIADEEADMEKNKKFGKAAEKGAAFRRLTAGTTTHPWDRDGKVQEREVEEHAMKELEDDARRRNLETHEQRSADVAKKRKTIREGTLDVD